MFDELVVKDETFEVRRKVVGKLENNIYLVKCAQSGAKIAIDATSADVDGAERVLITHGHPDHTASARQLHQSGCELFMGNDDDSYLSLPYHHIEDGTIFDVGMLQLKAIHTPGHTPGSTCFVLIDKKILFSGDTLFPGGPGATSKPDANFDQIIESISTKLFALPSETAVLPGHGAPTTIGNEMPHLGEWIQRGW